MPIPTRSQSIRGTKPASDAGSRLQAGSRKVTEDEKKIPQSDTASSTASTLPQPRHVIASGLPRAAGHARARSSATKVQASMISRATSTNPIAHGIAADISTEEGGLAGPHDSKSQPRHSRSQSSAIRIPQPQMTLKPAFNTYQQHFTPQKPRTVAQSTAREAKSRTASSSDGEPPHFDRLQDELLQLSLVHVRSQATLNKYKASATSKLERLATQLRRDEINISILEQKYQEDVNSLALVGWLSQPEDRSASDQVRSLSLVIKQLTELTNEHAPFTEVVQQFDAWLVDARIFLDRTGGSAKANVAGRALLPELGSSWQETVEALKAQVASCKQDLQSFREWSSQSALWITISCHHQLASAMLEELELCTQLHSSFSTHQQQYISQTLEHVFSEAEARDGKPDDLPRQPLWDVF